MSVIDGHSVHIKKSDTTVPTGFAQLLGTSDDAGVAARDNTDASSCCGAAVVVVAGAAVVLVVGEAVAVELVAVCGCRWEVGGNSEQGMHGRLL